MKSSARDYENGKQSNSGAKSTFHWFQGSRASSAGYSDSGCKPYGPRAAQATVARVFRPLRSDKRLEPGLGRSSKEKGRLIRDTLKANSAKVV